MNRDVVLGLFWELYPHRGADSVQYGQRAFIRWCLRDLIAKVRKGLV